MPFEKKRLKSLAYIQYEIVDLYEIGYLFSILVFGLLNSYVIWYVREDIVSKGNRKSIRQFIMKSGHRIRIPIFPGIRMPKSFGMGMPRFVRSIMHGGSRAVVVGWVLAAVLMTTGCGSMSGGTGNGKSSENVNVPGNTSASAKTTGKLKDYSVQNFFFDTVISVKITAGDNADELLQHCMDMCREYEQIFSRTDENSELYKVNHRTTNTVEVSEKLAFLISEGQKVHELSGGKFDITVAPLSDLWDFKSEDAVVPDQDKIREAQEKVDASSVHLDGTTLTFDRSDTMIDLGAIVKGYAADELAAYLKGEGVTSGLINLGGNVLTIGSKPDGSNWKIGIQKPFAGGELIDTVEVSGKTVVSSGVYERYFKQDGVIYHHILDPDTGYPVQDGIWGVSIICDSSLLGDELSTTCLAVGEEKAAEIIESMEGVEAIFVDDQLQVTTVGGG